MKITAHQIVQKPLEIVPASKNRQWMDDTIHRFAYRCLPLSIANSTGWMLLNPVDFFVSWDGHDNTESLAVHLDSSPFEHADSSFGYGILTIHPGYLFKTSPGWNLYVTGPPNYTCDFMQPLSGIVETWWLDFTFTMNWKLHHPGTFTVPKGMPLCHIFPVPEYAKIDMSAEIVPIQSNPQLDKTFEKWGNERMQNLDDMKKAIKNHRKTGKIDPEDPNTHWEKNYLQGIDKSGKKIDNHITSVKFPKFKKDS